MPAFFRFIHSRGSQLLRRTLITLKPQSTNPIYYSNLNPNTSLFFHISRYLSSNHNNGDDNNANDPFQAHVWKMTPDIGKVGDFKEGDVFSEIDKDLRSTNADGEERPWSSLDFKKGYVFSYMDKASGSKDGGGEEFSFSSNDIKVGNVFADVDKVLISKERVSLGKSIWSCEEVKEGDVFSDVDSEFISMGVNRQVRKQWSGEEIKKRDVFANVDDVFRSNEGDSQDNRLWSNEEIKERDVFTNENNLFRSKEIYGQEKEPWPSEEIKEGDVFADVVEEFRPKEDGSQEKKLWSSEEVKERDVFAFVKDDGVQQRTSSFDYTPWTLGQEDKEIRPFDPEKLERERLDKEMEEQEDRLEREEQELKDILRGPARPFGDLVAESGITNDMLDNLIALKDFEGVDGLPPLSEIEDLRLEKNTKKVSEVMKEPEKQMDEKVWRSKIDNWGVAFAKGRRKTAIAQVWIRSGDGFVTVNGVSLDTKFERLEHRADILSPFSETKTFGRFDVFIRVRGGGLSGKSGAIRYAIAMALVRFEPDLRHPLLKAGLLTPDTRQVKPKKWGLKKARKAPQWSKR